MRSPTVHYLTTTEPDNGTTYHGLMQIAQPPLTWEL